MRNTKLKFLFISLFLSTYLVASTKVDFVSKAMDLDLANQSYWSKLLHFENNRSVINNQEFFVSQNGKTDLEDELKKTIELFLEDNSSTCRYPARYKWINSHLNLNIQSSTCRELDKFLKPNFNKISIVFTAERYNSPSSVFGHTFIKLDSKTLPYAINYAAKVPKGTNPISYVYNGNSGGFQSHYNMITYNMKDFEYREEEFRDLINFDIKYSKDEIQNILYHMYEIKDTDEDYYFMSRNCSSEILKLLDMGKYDSTIRDELNDTTIPIDIIYILQNNGLIDKISRKYSKLKLFNIYMQKLQDDEVDMLQKIIKRKISIDEFSKTDLSQESKELIVRAALSYIEMNLVSRKLGHKYTSSLMSLIRLKNKYNMQDEIEKDIVLDEIPIPNKYHRFKMGTRSVSNRKTEYNLGYRYLYSNRFDLVGDEQKNGSVEYFDLNMKIDEDDDIELNYLSILNLESSPISNEFFKEHTTNFSMGLKRLFYEQDLYTYFDYALGYRFGINKEITYSFALRAGAFYHDEDIYMLSPTASLEYNLNNNFASELKYEANVYTDSNQAYNLYFNNYYKLTDSTNINILYSHKNDTRNYDELKINYSIYF